MTHTRARTHARTHTRARARTRTHTRLTALFPGLSRWAGTRKVKNQSGFYWSKRQWVVVASAGPYASLHLVSDRWPCQHPTTQFLQAGCPSCRPTNSVKALKAKNSQMTLTSLSVCCINIRIDILSTTRVYVWSSYVYKALSCKLFIAHYNILVIIQHCIY